MISDSPKQATAYEKLSDTLDAKLLDFNLKFITLLATLLIRPLANATDPFFRKNLGCRYFTMGSAFAAGFLWFVAMRLEPLINGFIRTSLKLFGYSELAQWVGQFNVPAWVGWVMFIAFSVLAGRNLGAAQLRESSGTVWHSMSRGESMFGSENTVRDFIIAAVVCLVFAYVSPPLALLFGLSRFMSFVLTRKQQRSIYARYLDEMDRRIEAGNLETTLRDGPPPKTTGGLYCPLPSRIKGEHRATVARIVTHSSLRPVPAVEQRPTGAPTPSIPATPAPPEEEHSTSPQAEMTAALRLPSGKSATMTDSQRIRYMFIGLAGIVALIGGAVWLGVRMGRPEHAPTPEAPQTTQAPRNTPARTVAAAPAQNNAPATSVTPVANAEAQAAQTAALLAKQEAARAATQRLEEARRLQQRAKAVEQLQNILKTQTEELAKFTDLCESRHSNNTNKISAAPRSYRAELHEVNNDFDRRTRKEVVVQKTVLGQLDEAIKDLSSNSNGDVTSALSYWDNKTAILEKNRQTLTGAWDDLDTDISNASKTGSLKLR